MTEIDIPDNMINYAESFPADYLNYYEELIKDTEFLYYIITQFIKMDKNFTVFRYELHYKDLLFPNSTFIEMQNLMKNIDKSTFDERQKVYVDHFVRIGVEI